MRAEEAIRAMAAKGQHHFTTEQSVEAMGISLPAARKQLRRLKDRGMVASPHRGFHVIIPPEYASLGCLPAAQFIPQLMAHLGEPYYFGLLSAAERHGAAHQRPQRGQVIVRKARRSINCGLVGVDFVGRGDLEAMPVVQVNTPRGFARYSSPETTALELVGHPDHCGGLSNVATVLSELTDEMEGERLLAVAALCPITWSQRLGYLLELVEADGLSASLLSHVRAKARCVVLLRRSADPTGAPRSPKWQLILNEEVEPDL